MQTSFCEESTAAPLLLSLQSEERREFELRIAEVSEKPLPPRVRDSMRRSYSPKATEIDSSVLVSAIPARISLVPNRVRSPSAAAPHRLRALVEVLEDGQQSEALAAALRRDRRQLLDRRDVRRLIQREQHLPAQRALAVRQIGGAADL